MTRIITGHQVNECNDAITITADERHEKYGNASHRYSCEWRDTESAEIRMVVINFQRGPIKEVGTNGLTHEALLAILIDRLEGFQSGAFACDENHDALVHLMAARDALFRRTQARVERGVEGANVV